MPEANLSELTKAIEQSSVYMKCPVWPIEEVPCHQTAECGELRIYFNSPRAGGVFSVPRPHCDEPPRIHCAEELRPKISRCIYDENGHGRVPHLDSDEIESITQLPYLRTEQRLDRFLRALRERLPGYPSDPIELPYDSDIMNLVRASTESGSDYYDLDWLASEASKAGLVREPKSKAYVLTFDGMRRLEGQGLAHLSNQAFVAMWFNDKVKAAYDEGIEPAIRDAGYTAVRIDRKDFISKIDDEIIAEIRRSRFVVCDFTCRLIKRKPNNIDNARGSVYYEAGFAHGLNIPVIFTCRTDLLDYLHFDVNHYPTITWTCPQDIRIPLRNRIAAVIGDGPGTTVEQNRRAS